MVVYGVTLAVHHRTSYIMLVYGVKLAVHHQTSYIMVVYGVELAVHHQPMGGVWREIRRTPPRRFLWIV